jgi:hypothetical protein
MVVELDSIWSAAKNALQAADVIVFVGYRFPPGDALAREQLLESIAANKRPRLRMHVVLGPPGGSNAGDITRLECLLLHTAARTRSVKGYGGRDGARTGEVKVWPMWAEDFLSVVQRAAL